MRQHQLDAFIHIWTHKGDLLMCLPTGYRKSLVHQLAAPSLKLREKGSVIIMSPLNIIHLDQINKMKHRGIKCCKLDIEGKAQIVNDGALIGENKFQHVFDDSDEVDDSNEQVACIISVYTF